MSEKIIDRAVELALAELPEPFDKSPASAIGALIRSLAVGVIRALAEAKEADERT